MKRTLPTLLLITLLAGSLSASAQNIIFKDGKTVVGTKLRRDGATVLATVPNGAITAELGYPAAQIASIEFPDPPQLKEATAQVAAGKPDQALTILEPVLAFYRGFKDIKGSFWGEAAVMKLQILTSLGRDREADTLAREMIIIRDQPEVVAAGTAAQALLLAKAGNYKQALAASNDIIKQDSADSETLAIAYVANGLAHYSLKEITEANFAFLHLPIFFPDQKLLMPPALLGSARCFEKLQAKDEFQSELDNQIKTLINSYPSSPEAKTAINEFPNAIIRIKKSNQ